jgi:hypothetical protein
MYRVTKQRVKCSDGKEANVAVFGYKMSWGFWDGDKLNHKWHFTSGCTASDRMASKGNITDRVVFEGNPRVYQNAFNHGSFIDNDIGDTPFPRIDEVSWCTK